MRQPEVEEFDWDQQVLPRPEPLFLLARPLRLGPLASATCLHPSMCASAGCALPPLLCAQRPATAERQGSKGADASRRWRGALCQPNPNLQPHPDPLLDPRAWCRTLFLSEQKTSKATWRDPDAEL